MKEIRKEFGAVRELDEKELQQVSGGGVTYVYSKPNGKGPLKEDPNPAFSDPQKVVVKGPA